jgi:hypothetical protein
MPDLTAASVGKALAPLLGGVGKEVSGLVADQIRFLRWKNAVKIVKKAARIAKENDVDPKQVPLKFIVPFIEGASLEDDVKDEKLSDMWANLLASAVTKYESRYTLYVDLLKKLSSDDAKCLSKLRSIISKESIYSDDGFDPDLWNVGDREAAISYTSEIFEKKKRHILKDFTSKGLYLAGGGYEHSILSVLRDTGTRADIIPIYYDISFFYDRKDTNGASGPISRKDIEIDGLLNLASFQLLEKFSSGVTITDDVDPRRSARISVAWVCLNSLGFDFIKACHRSGLSRKKSK